MSVKRGYGLNGKSLYTNVTTPQYTWLTFTVNAADTGGLGVTSVKSNGYVDAVFMHTSQTPGAVNGITNPNPQVGFANIIFKNPFNYWLGGNWMMNPPLTSTSTTSTTNHNVYAITSLGTATLAQWQAAGLPQGFTPTVGQTFTAKATGTIGGSATVGVPGVLTTVAVAPVGTPGVMVSNSNLAQNGGAQLTVSFLAATNSSTTTLVAAAPADGTVVYLQLCYDASTVTIDGI